MSAEKNEKPAYAKAAVDKLEMMRHSLSHIMAAAILKLYPKVKFAIGPAVDNGFYYDLDFGKTKISDSDLLKIEEEIKNIIKANLLFEKIELPVAKALAREKKSGQTYKLELIKDLKKQGEKNVSYYKLGEFEDLCRGPHIKSSGQVQNGSWKLEKLAGAYWRGDEKNKMLVRIYGLAFLTKQELDNYLKMMEEAEKRDHRKIGKEQSLFMTHDVAPGMPFFLPNGMVILNELIKFVREYSYGDGYREVRTPQLLNSELWKISGHWEHYQEDMFCLHHAEDNIDIGVKPMNCPAHMLIFKRDIHSYRELPLRIAETTTLYRNEKSGTLHGLTRVRSLSQDDTHIFLRPNQILNEILILLDKVKIIYTIFNLQIDDIHLSTRPEKYLGEKAVWDKAEANLKEALDKAGLKYQINEGDGAFYGPKIDVKVKDAIGRQWQLATIQLDFQLPTRFGLNYIDSDGSNKTPVVVHRAILGSMERFLGILIEHYAGAFPVWLSPVQVKIVSVGSTHVEFCRKLADEFRENKIRVEVDESDETVGNKIRKAVNEKVPYMLVIGDREMASDKLAVRDRGEKTTREVDKEKFMAEVKEKIKQRK
ncbi:MAG: threonine--tRNA ligase [Patescibacteria group bacterium]|nr:threonine--tRNA ligase [Patescibacteria group bacterium]